MECRRSTTQPRKQLAWMHVLTSLVIDYCDSGVHGAMRPRIVAAIDSRVTASGLCVQTSAGVPHGCTMGCNLCVHDWWEDPHRVEMSSVLSAWRCVAMGMASQQNQHAFL